MLYYGKVVRILHFGAFVELAPGKDGMVHISKLADRRVEKVEDVVQRRRHGLGQGHRHRREGPREPLPAGCPARDRCHGSPRRQEAQQLISGSF